MKSIQALRERHNALAQAVQALVATNNDAWKPDHQVEYDKAMAEIVDLRAQQQIATWPRLRPWTRSRKT